MEYLSLYRCSGKDAKELEGVQMILCKMKKNVNTHK